ncbi:hypothetical protein DRP43_03330 [candidate division TA06 bacterium]|uniref:histidine kinase n=1 Tax=candidate division TA06 bacterium TaxID=2250710 RepID=A0A660SKH6_UNCT6|nr:MAG: hypothetical protein DRP43_03330 [candidate division TA06 bacterium]
MTFPNVILLGAILNIFLAIIVFLSDTKNKLNKTFAIFCINLAAWNIICYLRDITGNNIYHSILYSSLSILPLTSYYFIISYLKKSETLQHFKYPFTIFSLTLFILSLIQVTRIALFHDILVFYLLIAFLIQEYCLINRFLKIGVFNERNRLRYIILATGILLVLGITDFVPALNFIRPINLGNIGNIIFSFIISYTILKSDIMPINYALMKIFTYILAATFFTFIFIFITLGFSVSFPTTVKAFISCMFILISYKILEKKIFQISERLLLAKHYRHQKVLQQLSEKYLNKNAEFNSLIKDTVDISYKILNLDNCGFAIETDSTPFNLYSLSKNCKIDNKTLKEWFKKDIDNNIYFRNGDKSIYLYRLENYNDNCGIFYFIYDNENFHDDDGIYLSTLINQVKGIMEKILLNKKIINMENIAFAGEIAAGIAHDIRNPLSSIKGAAQYLDDSIKGKDREYFKILLSDIERIEHIIERFQLFASRNEINKEIIAINNFIRNIKNRFRNKKLYVNNQCKNTNFLTDPIILEESIYNIIQNAFDSYEDNNENRVHLEISDNSNNIILSVIDNGRGLSIKNKNDIFLPFYTTKTDGIGLGLSITKRMIYALGGKILFKENPKGGTIFTIILEDV